MRACAGKSSLLAAVLGELQGVAGRVRVTGRLAYVPQRPWIMSGSLRANILFGRPVRARNLR
jgi:ABC-type transport system involved in cytochrome bd biosynthesis fused ATPase/permease subunit